MLKKAIIFVAAVACFFAVWYFEEHRRAAAVRPPAGATNLASFLQIKANAVNRIRSLKRNETNYFEVIGRPTVSPLSVASGPPAYIFDENGQMIDWAADRGENSSFVRKWGTLSNATYITPEEAIALSNNKAIR